MSECWAIPKSRRFEFKGFRMSGSRQKIPYTIRAKLEDARVARLATVDAKLRPHAVPICFAYDGKVFYTAIDQKQKRIVPERLTRLRNILAVPQVTLLIDQYDEDWRKLWYILIRGKAKLLPMRGHKERAWALRKLRAKYPQYAGRMLPNDAPIIRITPDGITFWGNASSLGRIAFLHKPPVKSLTPT